MRKIAVVLGVGILLAAGPASARTIVVDRGRANGKFASASANGSVSDPRALFVEVKSRPTNQRVLVIWNVFCDRPDGSGARSGQFHRRTFVHREVRMPFGDPDSCRIGATAQLSAGSGRIVVTLLARV